MNRALELDPLSPETQKTLGAILEWAGRYDAAIAQYKATLELDPKATDLHAYLADAYARRGLEKESIAERQLFLRGIGDEPTATALARDYTQLGYREAMGRLWRQTLAGYEEHAKSDYVSPMAFAYVYAALDDKPHALDWLEKAVEERTPWAVYLHVDPQFAGLRSDPRFSALVRRIGLPS
jgi:tetratricopeptide (TPR) repeat protein